MSTPRAQNPDQRALRDVETRKLETLAKIRELELELTKTNVELFKRGVDEAIVRGPLMCW